jgi:hypothetical protein
MTIAQIDAQIAQLKARRAKLVAQHETARAAQRAARRSEHEQRQARRAAERRALNAWVNFDAHGLSRRSLSLDECRRYAVVNGTKLKVVLFAAQSAGITVERSGDPGDPKVSPDASPESKSTMAQALEHEIRESEDENG